MGVVITEIIACDNINYLRMCRYAVENSHVMSFWLLDLDREEVFSSFWSSRWIFFVLHVLHNALVILVVLQILCDRQRASLFVSCRDGVLCLRVGP